MTWARLNVRKSEEGESEVQSGLAKGDECQRGERMLRQLSGAAETLA